MLTLGKSPISLLQEYCDKNKLPHPHYECTKLYNQISGFCCKCVHIGRTSWGAGADMKTAKKGAALKMCLAVKILSPEHFQKEVDEELTKTTAFEKSPWPPYESTIKCEEGNTLAAARTILMAEEHINGKTYQWANNWHVPHHDEGIQDAMWYGLSRRMQLLEEREYRRERELESVLGNLRQFQQGYVSVLEDIQKALKGLQHTISGQQKELEDLRGRNVTPVTGRLDDITDGLSALVQAFKGVKIKDSLDVINENDDLTDWIREVDDLRLRWLTPKDLDMTSSKNVLRVERPSMM